ncbi:HisA/HisF-related TIM barrel protein, partial [Phascolarctobacterium succinatutens]|uniref:HisA/HisF-related TIM barrel protein n=1 Tax=Phascolarctobacterium succinatutens TaxID=626940 RepID=UPI003AB4CD3F
MTLSVLVTRSCRSLIPAIDIIDGKCVRLTQGDYATKKVYNEDPLEVAKMFEGNGIRTPLRLARNTLVNIS